MTNEDKHFIEQFENCTLPSQQFNHLGHLKLAFLMIQNDGVEAAVTMVLQGIQRYAAALGAANKFHQTISWFMVKEVAHRMTRLSSVQWTEFVANNPDLINDAQAILAYYYSTTRLNSESARLTIILPDKNKPDWHV